MTDLPDLTPPELDALARKHGLRGPLTRLPSEGIVNRAYANADVVLRAAVPRELWNARPGSVLAHLLRFAVDAPDGWREWLRG